MEGVFFYWAGWTLWIVFTFFFSKTKKRLIWTVLLLCLLMSAPFSIDVFDFQVNVLFLLAFILLCLKLTKEKKVKLVAIFFASFIIALAIMGFELFSLYDPVLLFIDQRIYFAAIAFTLTSLFVRTIKSKLFVCSLGLLQGELLAALMKYHLFSFDVMGRLLLFDSVSLAVGAIFLVALLQLVILKLKEFLQSKVKQTTVLSLSNEQTFDKGLYQVKGEREVVEKRIF